jgi:hypothetical protein
MINIKLSIIRGPKVLGPKVLGPKVLGPKVLGPKVLGPKVLGPKVLGPKVLGPKVLGYILTFSTDLTVDTQTRIEFLLILSNTAMHIFYVLTPTISLNKFPTTISHLTVLVISTTLSFCCF